MKIIDNREGRLLTENQKVEFHSKALRYLQQNTRRCASCGGGQFNKLLGESAMNEIGMGKKRADFATNKLRSSLVSETEEAIRDFNAASKYVCAHVVISCILYLVLEHIIRSRE